MIDLETITVIVYAAVTEAFCDVLMISSPKVGLLPQLLLATKYFLMMTLVVKLYFYDNCHYNTI